MTTSVKIEAHCSADKEVMVETHEGALTTQQILQDGEELQLHVWDTRSVRVFEQLKEKK